MLLQASKAVFQTVLQASKAVLQMVLQASKALCIKTTSEHPLANCYTAWSAAPLYLRRHQVQNILKVDFRKIRASPQTSDPSFERGILNLYKRLAQMAALLGLFDSNENPKEQLLEGVQY